MINFNQFHYKAIGTFYPHLNNRNLECPVNHEAILFSAHICDVSGTYFHLRSHMIQLHTWSVSYSVISSQLCMCACISLQKCCGVEQGLEVFPSFYLLLVSCVTVATHGSQLYSQLYNGFTSSYLAIAIYHELFLVGYAKLDYCNFLAPYLMMIGNGYAYFAITLFIIFKLLCCPNHKRDREGTKVTDSENKSLLMFMCARFVFESVWLIITSMWVFSNYSDWGDAGQLNCDGQPDDGGKCCYKGIYIILMVFMNLILFFSVRFLFNHPVPRRVWYFLCRRCKKLKQQQATRDASWQV